MKLKFRISKKDLIILAVFLVFLLYLCAIGVVNIVNFGANGTLAGLNPIPAFTHYLGLTLLLYFVCVIVIFASVSSYVFEKKGNKGIGLVVEDKVETGYSSWAKDKDIKNDRGVEAVDYTAPTVKAAGIPLIYDTKKHQVWVDNGEYHTVVIGASGSGKSQCIVKPLVNLLAKKGESMIITDPKGELYTSAAHRLKDLGYNVIVLNFREPLKGNAWNPLTLPYQYMKLGNMDKATELLDDVALNILYDPNNKGEPFWEKSAADFFSGLALGLFEDAKEEEININSISVMSTAGEDRLGPSTYTKEYFTMKGEASSAYTFASNTINAPSDTKGGIMSTFRQKIRLFASRQNLSEMLGHSDFSILDIGKQKTAVFIVIHDEKTTYHALATIFIKQAYETLIDVAQKNGGKLPIRTNFILDEFANMPPLKDVDSMVTAARSRDMRFTFIIQNFAQLNDVYGKEVAEVIRGNCGNTIYLISSELAALEEISKMCGEVKSKEKDKTASTPLVTVSDLQKFKMGEALLIRMRKGPFKTKLQFDYKTSWGYEQIDEPFPERTAKAVALFDIKTFVKEKKKEQSLNNPQANSNPFGPNMFDNPFGASPFGNSNPFGASSNLFGSPSPLETGNTSTAKPSSTPSGGLDLDAMLKDIDRKIAELDAEEAREKEAAAKKTDTTNSSNSITKADEPKNEIKEVSPTNLGSIIEPPILNTNPTELKPASSIIKDVQPIVEEPKLVAEPVKTIEPTIINPEPIKQSEKATIVEPQVTDTKSDNNDFKMPDLDALLANLLGDDKQSIKEEPKPTINEVTKSEDKPIINIKPEELPDTQLEEVKPLSKVEPTIEKLPEEPIINPINNDILGEPPRYNPNASLRDLLYNPTHANVNVKENNNNIFINEDLINSEKDNYLKSTQTNSISAPEVVKEEPKPITNDVIKTEEKPIINIKPEELKEDNNISDDEFFDDFFGDE